MNLCKFVSGLNSKMESLARKGLQEEVFQVVFINKDTKLVFRKILKNCP